MTGAERDALILSLQPLVKTIARSRMAGLPTRARLEDIISAAWLGAISAVDRFDPARGVPLAAFAKWRISGCIGDYLRSLDPVSRDERIRLNANPDEPRPYTFSISRMRDDSDREFDIGDKRSHEAVRRIDARLDLAKIRKASGGVNPRSLRIVMSHAQGETMKDIASREGINESRVSQIRKATLLQMRHAAVRPAPSSIARAA